MTLTIKDETQEACVGTTPFSQYVWHHKVHEHLNERIRYFLLELTPYREDELKESLNNLVKDHDISGLRAYRVFGRYDLLIRAWMHNDTFARMPDLFDRYLSIGSVRVGRTKLDYVRDVEHRWYEATAHPLEGTHTAQEQLMNRLSYDVVSKIESGEDDKKFRRYKDTGLIVEKGTTANAITFFICVMFTDNSIRTDDRKELIRRIKEQFSKGGNTYLFAEIDSAAGGICNLMIRARVLAPNFFAIGDLTAWLSQQSHVSSTETYLSLTQSPLVGDTKLSLATFDARDPPSHKVLEIFADPYYPNGPYPRRRWGVTADDVVLYLLDKDLADHPRGFKTFLHNFLLGVLHKSPAEMGAAIIIFFKQLEGYLDRQRSEYFQRLKEGLLAPDPAFEGLYTECFPEIDAREHRATKPTLTPLLKFYYQASKKACRGLKSPSNWELLTDVRNWGAHGDDYKWEDARLKWKELANIMIRFGPDVESLYREVRSVCKSRDEGLPQIFPDE